MRIISNDLLRKLNVLIKNSDFDISKYLVFNEVNDEQQKIIDNATSILQENVVDEVKIFGGSIEKGEDKLNKLKENVKSELEKSEYNELRDDLENLINVYIENFQLLIPKLCGTIIPVKQLPFVDVYFRTVPRITIDKEKPQKMSIDDRTISYYGEIKCIIPRITLFGKLKEGDPLFAPLIGDLNLDDFNSKASEQKSLMIENQIYISGVISSLDKDTTKNNVVRYHEQYQRHGEPICDFLMKDDALMDVMNKLTTAIESKRTSSNVSVGAIAIPNIQNRSTLVIVVNESNASNSYATCFEALLRFSAACYEAPSTKKPSEVSTVPLALAQQEQVSGPGGQKLEVWTTEELVKDATERGLSTGVPPNMDSWTEEQLLEMAKSRTDTGVSLPEWSEEELEELAKSRQGALNLPEWEESKDIIYCPQCSYGCRSGWSECPICNWKVGEPVSDEKSEQEPSTKAEPISEEKIEPESSTEDK